MAQVLLHRHESSRSASTTVEALAARSAGCSSPRVGRQWSEKRRLHLVPVAAPLGKRRKAHTGTFTHRGHSVELASASGGYGVAAGGSITLARCLSERSLRLARNLSGGRGGDRRRPAHVAVLCYLR